ncbi:hypothetical protein K439DRAFT_1663809 [Ramaria rubella]|nr:hypothetical protein K439DRAFT_1663809 [Ramaria rubella]
MVTHHATDHSYLSASAPRPPQPVWTPPCSLGIRSCPSTPSTSLSVSPNFLKIHAASLIHFTKIRDNFNIPETLRVPASEPLPCAFLSTRGAVSFGDGTNRTWLEGLKLWHRIHSALWCGSPELKRVIYFFDNLTLDRAALHLLLTLRTTQNATRHIRHICSFRRYLDLTNSFDVAVFAIAAIDSWCCCRLGELLIIDSHFDPSSHIARSACIDHDLVSNGFPSFLSPFLIRKPNREVRVLS